MYLVGSFFILFVDYNKYLLVFYIVLPFLTIYSLPAFFIGSKSTWPLAVIAPISIFAGLFLRLYFKHCKALSIIGYILLVFFILGFSIYGFPNYYALIDSKSVNTPSPQLISEQFNYNNDTIALNKYRGKVIVLDFWVTSCGVCFRQFPEFEKFVNTIKTDTNVVVFAANIPLEHDSLPKTLKMIRKRNYTFPLLISLKTSKYWDDTYAISRFPHTIVIDKKGKVKYSGSFNSDGSVIINNINHIVNKLEHE